MAGRIDYVERQERKKEIYQERVEQAEQRSQAHYEKQSTETNTYNLLFWDYENNTFISGNEINSWLDRINA